MGVTPFCMNKHPNSLRDWRLTETVTEFGIRLKQLREHLSLTQVALAECLGVSFATVNRWENGWTAPSRLAARQIDLLCEEHKIESVTRRGEASR